MIVNIRQAFDVALILNSVANQDPHSMAPRPHIKLANANKMNIKEG